MNSTVNARTRHGLVSRVIGIALRGPRALSR